MLLSINQLVTGQSSCSCVNCKKILAGPNAGTYISMGSQENNLNFQLLQKSIFLKKLSLKCADSCIFPTCWVQIEFPTAGSNPESQI